MALFGGLFGMLVSAALFGDAAIRDAAAGMDPLLYTTRLRKAEYLGGRFLAALAINAILVLAIPLGFWIATHDVSSTRTRSAPTASRRTCSRCCSSSCRTSCWSARSSSRSGALARQVIPVYLGTAAIFIGYIVAANYWNDIESPLLSALADPLGINALLAMTRVLDAVGARARG